MEVACTAWALGIEVASEEALAILMWAVGALEVVNNDLLT